MTKSTKQCRACKSTIDARASRCPNCTEDLSVAKGLQEVGKGLFALGCLVVLLPALTALIFGAMSGVGRNSPAAPPALPRFAVEECYAEGCNVDIHLDADPDASATVAAIGNAERELARKLEPIVGAQNAKRLKFVNTMIFTHWNGAETRLMHLSYPTEALARIAVDGTTVDAALDEARDGGHWPPAHDRTFTSYCTDRETTFCDRITSGDL